MEKEIKIDSPKISKGRLIGTYTPNKYSFLGLIWMLWGAYKFRRDISNYLIAESSKNNPCEGLPNASQDLRRRYGIEMNSVESLVWAVVEKHCKEMVKNND